MLKTHAYPTMHAVAAPSPEVPIASPVPVDTTMAFITYVTGNDTVEAVAERYGHSVPALRKRAFREQWGAERAQAQELARESEREWARSSIEDKRREHQAETHKLMMMITNKLGEMLVLHRERLSPRNLRDAVSALARVQRVAHINLGIDRKTARATAQATPPMAMPEIVPSQTYDLSRLSDAELGQLTTIAAKVNHGA